MKAITLVACFLSLSYGSIEENFSRSNVSVDYVSEAHKIAISDYEKGCLIDRIFLEKFDRELFYLRSTYQLETAFTQPEHFF